MVAALGGSSVFGAGTVTFIGLYLVAIGSGSVRSSLLPFGVEQLDDVNVADRESVFLQLVLLPLRRLLPHRLGPPHHVDPG
jgi:hypothetical protein